MPAKTQAAPDDANTTIAVLVGLALIASAGIALALQDDGLPASSSNQGDDRSTDTDDEEKTAGETGSDSEEGEDASSNQAGADEHEAGEEEETRTHAVDWEGRLSPTACVPAGPHTCYGTSLGDGEDRYDTAISANLTGAGVRLEWDATTPITEELKIALAVGGSEECGAGTCFFFHGVASQTGKSPLKLEIGETSIETGTLWLLVDVPDPTPDPLYGKAHLEQPFHAQGTIETVGPPSRT